MKDPSFAPKHVRELAALSATFPVRLWMAALVAACVLTWTFAIPAAEDAESAQASPVPTAKALAGNAS